MKKTFMIFLTLEALHCRFYNEIGSGDLFIGVFKMTKIMIVEDSEDIRKLYAII